MIFKKGHKSDALLLLGVLFCIVVSIGTTAYFMIDNTEETNKVSIKAAGVDYRKQYTVAELMSVPDIATGVRQRKNISSIRNGSNINSTSETEQEHNSALTRELKLKQPKTIKSTKISSDLKVLSSFDCVKSIPTVLLDYISTTFLTEYGLSYTDFHSQYKFDKRLPLLKSFNINCGTDQNCSTLFQYDKQYGLNTTANNTYQREDMFYCCPNVHSKTNQTLTETCKHAQTVAGKSVFRESTKPLFLELVEQLATHETLYSPINVIFFVKIYLKVPRI